MKNVLTATAGIMFVAYANLCIYGWVCGYDSILQMLS